MAEAPKSTELQQGVFNALIDLLRGTAWHRLRDIFFEQHWSRKKEVARNPLLKSGRKYFSQNDEDGIVLEICRRLGLNQGVFAELGVGNGLENNTLILLMSGWQGVWVGGEKLAFEVPDESRLSTPENSTISPVTLASCSWMPTTTGSYPADIRRRLALSRNS